MVYYYYIYIYISCLSNLLTKIFFKYKFYMIWSSYVRVFSTVFSHFSALPTAASHNSFYTQTVGWIYWSWHHIGWTTWTRFLYWVNSACNNALSSFATLSSLDRAEITSSWDCSYNTWSKPSASVRIATPTYLGPYLAVQQKDFMSESLHEWQLFTVTAYGL